MKKDIQVSRMIFSSLDTIKMEIRPDRLHAVNSFILETPKMQLISEQRIFVVTNYFKTRKFK